MLLHKSVVHDSRVRREAKALVEAGHEVTVLELDRAASGTLDGFARVSVAPPPWVRRMLPFHAYRLVFLAAFVARLVRLRPDVVHAHDAAMLLPGLLGKRLTRATLVYDSHELATGVPYRDGRWARFVTWAERVGVPRADAVITVSDGIAGRLQELYGLRERPVVLRNVTDLEAPPAPTGRLRAKLGIGEAPLVLHQGAPAEDRGCEVLIAAMNLVPEAHLCFLGSGEPAYEAGLRAIAGERVHFLASVALDELLEHTADADVGVSLLQDTCENHRLALPNKVFEYVAAGLPMVVSDLPEVRQLVERHGIGVAVTSSDIDAIGAGLRSARARRHEPDLRVRLERASRLLSWTRERHRLTAAYDRLDPRPARGRALVFVRNTAVHDARVHREVETLIAGGWEPIVAGVVSDGVRERRGTLAGAPLVRLDPRSLLTRARALRTRRVAAAPGASAEAPRGARPRTLPLVLRAPQRALTALDYYRQGVQLVRKTRPTLIHCNDWNTMWIGVAARVVTRARVIYDAHELWPDRNGRPEWRRWLLACEWLFTRVAHEVITTSPGYADEIASRYGVASPTLVRNVPQTVTVGNGTRPPGEPPVLAYVGGLLRGRGLEQAIAALPYLPAWRLRLIGPGAAAYREELAASAGRLGVADRVEFRDAVPPDRVVAALAGADAGLCLIQPVCRSYELTLPNKLFEYAAAGVPILASDLPVIAAVVREHDLGEVVPPDDVHAIVAGLERLLQGPRHAVLRRNAAALARTSTWTAERQILRRSYGAPPDA